MENEPEDEGIYNIASSLLNPTNYRIYFSSPMTPKRVVGLHLGRIYDEYHFYITSLEDENPEIGEIHKAIYLGIIQRLALNHPMHLFRVAEIIGADTEDIAKIINETRKNPRNSPHIEELKTDFAIDLTKYINGNIH